MNQLLRWVISEPIHAALTIGFGSAFASGTLEMLQRALAQSAPVYALLSITMIGLALISQSRRCANIVVWACVDTASRPR